MMKIVSLAATGLVLAFGPFSCETKKAPDLPPGTVKSIETVGDREKLTIKWPDGDESVAFAVPDDCEVGQEYPACVDD